ncbi:lysosomal-trafficking regulator [Stomoxys calcitrans]|uniref:lysosomal-trafficking regulator n=1 Tax=Stomoxys calcitrans TaxID=35570 RepID=UPI0027E321EF|nr:lysosomal-trafficking regulator [Stomoxys calcitrans]XP_059217199.1 lysosomal-trafficking regulator [Stomoxys calcitrans]
MESIYTATHLVYHGEYELLFDTLQLIWHNYMQETAISEGDVDVKQHWLQLFLYNFQFVPKELLEDEAFKSFFNPIPEEICSYLLEQVYDIISKSDLYAPSLTDVEPTRIDLEDSDSEKPQQQQQQTQEKNKHLFQLLKKNHNFAQLILKQPSDCSKILALRQFLTHQLGQHLLEFLLKIDVKLIASQSSLCNLCINLFPNCPWDQQALRLKDEHNIFAFIGDLQLLQKHRNKSFTEEHDQAIRDKQFEYFPSPQRIRDFLAFQSTTKTSDEIAVCLIQLLMKCIDSEMQSLHSDHSVFMLILNFSLDCLRVENGSFSSIENANIIKCYLVKLNEQCLSNLFALTDHALSDLQFQCIFAKLIAALESNTHMPKLLYAIIYLIFAILQNVVCIYSQKTVWNAKINLYSMKFIDETVIDTCLSVLDDLLQYHKPEEADVRALFHIIFRCLLKIVENLKRYDLIMCSSSSNSYSTLNHNSGKSVPLRYRKVKTRQAHCLQSLPRLTCYFQNILITLLPALPRELQEHSMLYLARSGLCCCHYKLSLFNTILNTVFNLSTYYQKCAYKFLYYKLISTIFLRCPLEQVNNAAKKSNINSCAKCDAKLKSSEFHEGLLQIYKTFYGKLINVEEDRTNLLFFLKHLKHLSHLLTNDIASGVIAEIVLPIFRSYKLKLFAQKDSKSDSPQHTLKFWQRPSTSPDHQQRLAKYPELHLNIESNALLKEEYNKLLNECLSIFSMYLRDIRLIKAFYNEENIRHLEELLEEPYLIRGVCDLIKIGIDNITFLGDTNQEQIILSRRLITLQFNSSERAHVLFNSLIQRVKRIESVNSSVFWLDTGYSLSSCNSNSNSSNNNHQHLKLKTVDILHIVALQWTLNYELLKTSQYFYNEFAKIYSIAHEEDEDDEHVRESEEDKSSLGTEINSNITLKPGDKTILDILQLNYNALNAFLMLAPKRTATKCTKAANVDKDFDSSWELIENFINAIQDSKATTSSLSISSISSATWDSSSAGSITTLCETAAFNSLYSREEEATTSPFHTAVTCERSQSCKSQSFLKQLQEVEDLAENPLNESITLFDIRNQKHMLNDYKYHHLHLHRHHHNHIIQSQENECPTSMQQALYRRHSFSPSDTKTITTATAAAAAAATLNGGTTSSSVGIINKLFHIFGSIFSGSRSNSFLDLHKSTEESPKEIEIDDDLLPLFDTRGDCKKLLLKLFEATMAICVKGYQNEEVEKMQKHLRKLKTVILANATSNWEQHAEEHNRENTVLQTLQCLLKIAELSNMNHEPAAVVVSTSNLTSPTDEQHTEHYDLRARRKSCNSARMCSHGLSYNYPLLSTGLPSKNALITPITPSHTRPLSGDSCDADYFSTRASVACCPDSELELSENELDDFYLTADEGYEADGEIQDLSETEVLSDVGELWHAFQPSSRYRTHILHEGICRLVIDILIELSQKCCETPGGWCDNLAQLVNRLFVIREYLGGPLFLLQGFAPILKCNDARLRELQQCILELIVDLNSPEVLSVFFSILSSRNPPVDILLKYMHYICSNTLKKCQASVELEFPINNDDICISAAEKEITEAIERKRFFQLSRKVCTPLTRSPCILPITHARLWTPEGFTISLWLYAKGSQNHKSTSQIIDDDTRSSNDIYTKTHILSIGTNQAMLSIYLSNSMHLVFETYKPNAEINRNANATIDETNETKQDDAANANPPRSPEVKRNKKNNHGNNLSSPDTECHEMDVLNAKASTSSPLSKALKQTKNVILNSFSNMHLFNGHSESADYFESSHVELKQYRMNRNKWTHFTVAVEMLNDSLEMCLHIDGLEQYRLSLPFQNIRLLTRTHTFQAITLGDGVISKSPNNTSCTESRSTLDSFPMRLSMTNLILFNRSLTLKDVILNLTAMGPDFTELTQCQVANMKANYGYLNFAKLQSAYFCNFLDSMKLLRESRILCYSASQPDVMMAYDTSIELDNVAYGRPYGIMRFGEFIRNELQSLQTSTILCGGLSNLLYLFARIVEVTPNASTQSMALDILLTIALSESQLYTEFLRNDYISLIGYVIKTEKCSKDCQLLRSIVNNACSQPLIVKRGDVLQINETTIATVVYPKLLISVLHRYSDWHRSGAENSDVLDMLFQCILALTREKHPQRDFNIEQLNKEGLMRELLNLFKVYVIESPNPVFISKKAAESFVNIISVFAGSPPKPFLLDEIMKLLWLLHKPSECYITHDRSKFYFLLTSEKPIKEKSSLSSATNFGRNFKQNLTKRSQPGVATPIDSSLAKPNSNLSSNTSNSDVDAARQARINRLRRLHRSLSSYRRPIDDFEENLDNVADCSKLNKSALRLINPAEASKWRSKFKKQQQQSTHFVSIATQAKPSPLRLRSKSAMYSPYSSPHHKIRRRRIRLNSETSVRSPTMGDKEKWNEDNGQSLSAPPFILTFSDCPGFNEVFNSSKTTLQQQRKHKMLTKPDSFSSVGIAALQSGLILLLKDFLCLLPDNDIDDVLRHYIKIEFLLVLANHQSPHVRSSVIKLMNALTQRLFPQDIQACTKAYYPHHLANQLSIGYCDSNMFESCLEWVCDKMGSLPNLLKCEVSLSIQQRFGLNSLLAIASKSVASSTCQSNFSAKAFKVLKKLYLTGPDDQLIMIDAGLIQCCVKALYYLYSKTTPYNIKTEESIGDILTTMGDISLKSMGHINIIWDIVNALSFYQDKQPQNIIKGYRSMLARLLLDWLKEFFVNTNVPWRFKVQQFPNFSMSETKTRLELLINRCCQFFMIFNEKSTPTANEIELFQMLVSYSIATNQRCNNFIAWGLQPSHSRDLRSFIVDALWISCHDDFTPSIICDGKMIKALLWLSLLEDLDEPIANLQKLCKRLGINENDSTWNLENELQRIDVHKSTEVAKQKSLLEKTVYRFEAVAQGCIESSMITTRRVAELQNSERKLIMTHMKDYDDTLYYNKWLEIVRRMTHEGAPWFSEHNCENSWELDPTEGPSRVHTRLKRCHLDLDKRFFMQSYDETKASKQHPEYSRPLEYLISSYDQQLNISLNSQILYNFPAKYLPVDGEIDGEIIVTDHKLYFLATYRCKYFYVNCDISNITEIWLKRYQHQEKAFEIFLDTNKSLFFSLHNQDDWKIMREVFCDKIVVPPDQNKVLLITQQWREGLLTNWEYLMTLNQIAGRTYNDLMQYPIFPWILANYTTDILDLTEPQNFRKLSKPIAVQNEENEQHYINNYTYIKNTMTNMGSLILKPYHYSSHYSNSGIVLHFLVRVPPFTSYFLRYQDNNFDLPDRTFHDLSTTFSLASRDSTTDVKELIPEFFCLPEMFENFEHFKFGCRQNGESVENVSLPPWCLKDPRLFIMIHRQALESELVRNNLHHWIDLIFGYKQMGEAAVEAINVFHPVTYAAFLESDIEDPIEREAVQTMIKTYGQMPRQLFKTPHPPSKPLAYQNDKQIVASVRGLRWGVYLGSPQLSEPVLGNTHKLIGAEYLLSFNNTNVVYGLPARSCVMQGAESDTYNVISWGYDDRIVRIQPLNKLHAKPKNLLYNSTFDDITACGCDPNSNELWFGHKSGRISIYKCSSVEASFKTGKSRQSYVKDIRFSYNSVFHKIISKAMDSEVDLTSSTASANSLSSAESNLHKDGADLNWSGPTVLVRHTDEITCITLSVEFKIAVTAGKDGIAVIWDLNDWSYIRTIDRPTAEIHHSPITLLTISHTLGDIVTVHSLAQPQQNQTEIDSSTPHTSMAFTSSAAPLAPVADECFEVTEENLDDFVNVCINPNGKSMLRLHSVNARYIQHFVHEDRITAVCYSYIKEGVGVNVIATAVEGGIVRLWSSWNLSFIMEIVTGISNIRSLTYSTHQHLVVLTENSHIQVWETKGLYGNSPKFPQIAYK